MPTASRIAVKRSGATPRSRAGPRDDTPFADATAPPLPGGPAAVAAAPLSERKPPPDGAPFSEERGSHFVAGVEATEAAQLFGLPRRPASSAPIGHAASATDWQFIPQPLAGVGGRVGGGDGRGYCGVGGGHESGRGYRGVLPAAREDGAIGGSLLGLNRPARRDHELGEVGAMRGGPCPAPMPRGSSSGGGGAASTATERARPLAPRGTAPLPPHRADWLATKSALPCFDNERSACVTSDCRSSLFSLVGGGRAHNSPHRLDNPPPPLAASPPPLRRRPEACCGDAAPRAGLEAASVRGAAACGAVAARGAAAVAASGDGQGLQQFSAGVDAWFSSATSSKRKKARRMLPPPPHLRPHTHTPVSHPPRPFCQAEPERVFGWLGQRPATPAASAATKPSDRPMHKFHDHRPANDPAGLWRGDRESASAKPPPQAITSQARRQQPRFAPSPPRQRASTGKAAARVSQSEAEPPPATNHLPPNVFFSGAALLAELGPGIAPSVPAQMKRFGRFATPYSSDRAQ